MIIRIVLGATIAGTALAYLPVTGLDPVDVPKLAVLLTGTAIAAAIQLSWSRNLGKVPRSLLVASLALPAGMFISWIFSPYRGWSLYGHYGKFQGLIPYLLVAILGLLVARASADSSTWVLWVFAGSGGVVALYGIVGIMGLDPWSRVVEGTRLVRETSTLGNSNFVGGFLAVALVASTYLWLEGGRGNRIAMATLPPIVLMLYVSGSQVGWGAAFAGVAVLVGSRLAPRWSIARPAGLAIATLVTGVLVSVVILGIAKPEAVPQSARSRGDWWTSSLEIFATSPLVGKGPDSFVLEISKHRSPFEAVSHRGFAPAYTLVPISYAPTTDPHSTFLSLASSGGLVVALPLLGLAGFALLQIARGTRASANDQALAALLVAYLVQSLLSVDHIALRTGFWVALGALSASSSLTERSRAPKFAPLRLAGSVALVALGLFLGSRFLKADLRARSGTDAFGRDRADAGAATLASAAALRPDVIYDQLLAEENGLLGLERGPQGEQYIESMRDHFGFLDEIPFAPALHSYARLMSYWGHFDPIGEEEALALFRRLIRIDPNNPLARVETAETLVDLGRLDDAWTELVSARARGLAEGVPEYWGTRAIVASLRGDAEEADAGLAEAVRLEPRGCRTLIASELLSFRDEGRFHDPGVAGLELALACDRGLVNFFLDLLPPDARSAFSELEAQTGGRQIDHRGA